MYTAKDVSIMRNVHGSIVTNVPARFLQISPTGFEVGYAGSGPREFAYNILLYVTEDESLSKRLYNPFVLDIVSKIKLSNGESALIKEQEIKEWVEEYRDSYV